MNDLMSKIEQPGANRAEYIDELTDMLDDGALNDEETIFVVERLTELLGHNDEPAVWESVFNLFGSVSGDQILLAKITEFTVKHLFQLNPGCLVHAIPIICDSTRPDKNELIRTFLDSSNAAVKRIAIRYMGEI